MKIKNKPFHIVVSDSSKYNKKTIISFSMNNKVIVLRRYKTTWLRLLLKKVGIKTKINYLKVKRL